MPKKLPWNVSKYCIFYWDFLYKIPFVHLNKLHFSEMHRRNFYYNAYKPIVSKFEQWKSCQHLEIQFFFFKCWNFLGPIPCHAAYWIYITQKKNYMCFMCMLSKIQICRISFSWYPGSLRASGHYIWWWITNKRFVCPTFMYWHTKN